MPVHEHGIVTGYHCGLFYVYAIYVSTRDHLPRPLPPQRQQVRTRCVLLCVAKVLSQHPRVLGPQSGRAPNWRDLVTAFGGSFGECREEAQAQAQKEGGICEEEECCNWAGPACCFFWRV